MQVTPTQEDITVYSTDPSGVKERPSPSNYANGVDVGYTAPAKWWNWFWNKITSILNAHKADWIGITAEMSNTLTDGYITPSVTDEHQLRKAIDRITYDVCYDYDHEDITEEIGGVEVTHKKNQPYVIGHTLYIPDTELL